MGDLAGMGGARPKTLAQLRCTRAAGLNFSTGNWTRLRRRTLEPLQSAPAPPAFRAGRRALCERIALLTIYIVLAPSSRMVFHPQAIPNR